MGRLLAKSGFDVCSGGYAGIMEAVSKGARSVGGKTIGITVQGWENIPNEYLDEEAKMPNLMERITELVTIADGYVILRGGTGTLVELSVTLELMNKSAMPEKPLVLLGKFWNNLIEILALDSERLNGLIGRNVRFAGSPLEAVNMLQSAAVI